MTSVLEALPICDAKQIEAVIDEQVDLKVGCKTEIKYEDIRILSTGTSIFVIAGHRKKCETRELALDYLEKIMRESGSTTNGLQYVNDAGVRINCLEKKVDKEILGKVIDSSQHHISINRSPVHANFVIRQAWTTTMGNGLKFENNNLYESTVFTIQKSNYSRDRLILMIQSVALGLYLGRPRKETVSTHEIYNILLGFLAKDPCDIVISYLFKMILTIE